MGAVPIAISVETFPKAPIPGTELDVPRLAAPRGPARGRARANLRDLSTVCLSTIAASEVPEVPSYSTYIATCTAVLEWDNQTISFVL